MNKIALICCGLGDTELTPHEMRVIGKWAMITGLAPNFEAAEPTLGSI